LQRSVLAEMRVDGALDGLHGQHCVAEDAVFEDVEVIFRWRLGGRGVLRLRGGAESGKQRQARSPKPPAIQFSFGDQHRHGIARVERREKRAVMIGSDMLLTHVTAARRRHQKGPALAGRPYIIESSQDGKSRPLIPQDPP
jgi:hypothetical protein